MAFLYSLFLSTVAKLSPEFKIWIVDRSFSGLR